MSTDPRFSTKVVVKAVDNRKRETEVASMIHFAIVLRYRCLPQQAVVLVFRKNPSESGKQEVVENFLLDTVLNGVATQVWRIFEPFDEGDPLLLSGIESAVA
jgi:hypothetical protein